MFEIKGNANSWIHYYDSKSDRLTSNLGFHQGIVIGPIFFKLFLNDLYQVTPNLEGNDINSAYDIIPITGAKNMEK